MSIIEKAIRAVRDAETAAADVAGNMESARFLVERCESRKETLQALEWATQNLETAKWRIRDALEAVREMDTATDARRRIEGE